MKQLTKKLLSALLVIAALTAILPLPAMARRGYYTQRVYKQDLFDYPIIEHGPITLEALQTPQPDSERGYVFFRVKASNTSDKNAVVRLVYSPDKDRKISNISKTFNIAPGEEKIENIAYINLCTNEFASFAVYIDGKKVRDFFDPGVFAEIGNILIDTQIDKDAASKLFFIHDIFKSRADAAVYNGYPETLCGNWLAYSGFEMVMLRSSSLEKMPEDVRNALFDYCRAGGNFVVLKNGRFEPPTDFIKTNKATENKDLDIYSGGFGELFVANERILGKKTLEMNNSILHRERFNRDFDRYSVKEPMLLIFFVLAVFVFIGGPINLFVLHLKKKKLYMFITVPVLSLICCFVLFTYYQVFFKNKLLVNVSSITLLNQSEHRSITQADLIVCSAGGRDNLLSFDYNTGVFVGPQECSNLKIELDKEQKLCGGWLEPNIVLPVSLINIQKSRENISILRGDSELSISNGLGAKIETITLVDKDGKKYIQQNIPPGESKKCKSCALEPPTSLAEAIERLKASSCSIAPLPPSTYFAKLAAPHFEGLNAELTAMASCSAYVFGILEEEP